MQKVLSKVRKDPSILIGIIIGVILLFVLLSNFYHWDRIGVIYLPFAFTINGIFSNNWMFISSVLYSVVGIIIFIKIFINKYIKGDKTKTNTIYIKKILFTIIGVYLVFYITNPWYTLQMYPRLFMYQDGKNITNKEIYFYLTEKFGFKGDLYKPFKNIDDSIAGLEFAMENNESGLYESIFYDMEKFGYINVLEKYKDKTFQSYLLRKVTYINTYYETEKNFFLNNLNILDYLEKNSNNEIIKDVSSYTKKEYEKLKKLEIEEKTFYDEIDNYGDKVYDIIGINNGMFGNQNKLYKFKKNVNGDWELIENKINN